MSLTDYQLKIAMDAARTLPVEKRDVYLQRIAAMLALAVAVTLAMLMLQTWRNSRAVWPSAPDRRRGESLA